MKTLKNVSAIVLIALSTSAFATENSKKEKFNLNYTVQKYIDALTYGKMEGISQVLDTDAKFTITGGKKILSYNRSQILASLQSIQNVQQNCVTGYSVVELNTSQAVVKVTMKYANFSRVNFLSMANTAEGWKITNVSSSFT
jgi:hypothetical protein